MRKEAFWRPGKRPPFFFLFFSSETKKKTVAVVNFINLADLHTSTINIYRKHSPSHYRNHFHLNLEPHHQQCPLFFFLLLQQKFNRNVAN